MFLQDFVWPRITDEGLLPETRVSYILVFFQSNFKFVWLSKQKAHFCISTSWRVSLLVDNSLLRSTYVDLCSCYCSYGNICHIYLKHCWSWQKPKIQWLRTFSVYLPLSSAKLWYNYLHIWWGRVLLCGDLKSPGSDVNRVQEQLSVNNRQISFISINKVIKI